MSPKDFSDEWDRLNEKYAALQVALADSVVRAWPDNLVGALALDDMAYKDTARFMSLYNEASDMVKSFRYVANDYKTISILSNTAPGKMFLDYTVKGGNPDGSDVSLSDYIGKGKYILLDHWASWCGPCKAEIPAIRKAYDAFKGDRFDVVSIACSDKREDTVKALSELDMPWNQILDAQKIPVELYGVATIGTLCTAFSVLQGEYRLFYDFRYCGVREYNLFQPLHRHTLLDGNAGAVDHLRGRIPEHVNSQDFMARGANKYLAKTFSPFILRHEAAGICHGKFEDRDIDAFPGSLVLRESDSGYFRIGIDNSRNGFIAHLVVTSEDIVDGNLGLADRGMRKQGESRHITGSVDIRHVGPHAVVHLDTVRAAGGREGEGDAQRLQPVALQAGPPAHGDEYLVPVNPADIPFGILVHHGIPFYSGDLAAKAELDSFLGILLLEEFAYLGIHRTEYLRHHFDHRDL